MTPELKVSAETIALLQFLLPGFLSAWLIYSFTPFKKPEQFDQVVHALILALVVKALLAAVHWACLALGTGFSVGKWTDSVELTWTLILAVGLGIGCVAASSHDWLGRTLRKAKATYVTSQPSEWYEAFVEEPRYVTLVLADGRRIIGWPRIWPRDPQEGHMVLGTAAWLGEKNEVEDLMGVAEVMIPAKDIQHVLFMKEKGVNERTSSEAN